MNRYIRYGLMGTDQLKITSVRLPEEDLEFIRTVYPEPGVQGALAGSLVAHFADYLRANCITSPEVRRESPTFAVLSLAVESFCSTHLSKEKAK